LPFSLRTLTCANRLPRSKTSTPTSFSTPSRCPWVR
jgi:hypothetical protein